MRYNNVPGSVNTMPKSACFATCNTVIKGKSGKALYIDIERRLLTDDFNGSLIKLYEILFPG